MLYNSLLGVNKLGKTKSAFFVSLVYSLLPKDQTFQKLLQPLEVGHFIVFGGNRTGAMWTY